MKIPLFQIDAFTSQVFAGNPAAVCLLEAWIDEPVLQAIAAENNLSETAFLVKTGETYEIRWFTPQQEVDLCGHATLASGFVVLKELEPDRQSVTFASKSGPLGVERQGGRLSMSLPARPAVDCALPAELEAGLGLKPESVLLAADKYLAVYESQEQVRALAPKFEQLRQVNCQGVIVTALARDGVDFVCRYFAPQVGIPEDPVTGSAHCTLVPYWAERLGKTQLHARQVSARGGTLFCELQGNSVLIAGEAVKYLEGTLEI